MKKISILFLILLSFSCVTHKRSFIKGNEEFVVELKKPSTRGGIIDIGLQAVFLGATYLAEETQKSLISSYSQSLSVNDYYNNYSGDVNKTYNEIHIKKFSKPVNADDKQRVKTILTSEYDDIPKTRGENSYLALEEIIREESDDLLNFHAIIEIISDPENPGISRLSFKELHILFSKTKVYEDENLNAKISILITGEWRDRDGSPRSGTLVEQEYDLKNLKYGYGNQITDPILSPWYYDIPINSDLEKVSKYGVLKVSVQFEEYEGKKSKYVNQLPSILSDNKSSIIKQGNSVIEQIFDK
jgi:hypothetical protein